MPLVFDEDKSSWAEGAAIANVTGTPGASYTAGEQGIIAAQTAAINAMLAVMRDAGLIALD